MGPSDNNVRLAQGDRCLVNYGNDDGFKPTMGKFFRLFVFASSTSNRSGKWALKVWGMCPGKSVFSVRKKQFLLFGRKREEVIVALCLDDSKADCLISRGHQFKKGLAKMWRNAGCCSNIAQIRRAP